MTRAAILAIGWCVAFTACERDPAPKAQGSAAQDSSSTSVPATPPSSPTTAPHLVPRMTMLKELADAAPPGLDDAAAAELRDLIEAAYSEGNDEDIASRAARRLENDSRAPLALESGLSHEQAPIRTRCAYALAKLGSTASVPALLLRLRVEQDRPAKLWMAGAILEIGVHCAPALDAVAANFEDPLLSADASQILNDVLAKAGVSLSSTATWEEARTAWQRLRDHWIDEGFPLGASRPTVTTIDEIEPRLRGQFAEALVELSEFQLRPVDEARVVLRNLGILPLPLLRLALTASEPYVRAHAVEVVRDIGPAARTLESEIVALLDDPLTRLTAIQAIGLMRANTAIPRLHALLTDDDPELACAAAASLGELRDETSRTALLTRMNDEAAILDVRIYAAFGLARLDRTIEGGGVGLAFLRDAKVRKLYHEPTLDELIANSQRR